MTMPNQKHHTVTRIVTRTIQQAWYGTREEVFSGGGFPIGGEFMVEEHASTIEKVEPRYPDEPKKVSE